MEQQAYFILPIQNICYILWHIIWLFSVSINDYPLEDLNILTSSSLKCFLHSPTAHWSLVGAADVNTEIPAARYKASKVSIVPLKASAEPKHFHFEQNDLVWILRTTLPLLCFMSVQLQTFGWDLNNPKSLLLFPPRHYESLNASLTQSDWIYLYSLQGLIEPTSLKLSIFREDD